MSSMSFLMIAICREALHVETASPEAQFLFRGVSMEMHKSGRGLSPKGTILSRTIHLDEPRLRLDMGLTLDDSVENVIVTHQLDSDYYRDAGISTTPHLDRARHYATHGGAQEGVVYRIDRQRLDLYGVRQYRVRDYPPCPKCPEDDEVILVHGELGSLPSAIVVAVISVQP